MGSHKIWVVLRQEIGIARISGSNKGKQEIGKQYGGKGKAPTGN